MRAEEVVGLYIPLTQSGVRVWVDGGWGIDALIGKQTRPHKDFDALVPFDDLSTLADMLADHGFALKEIWGENRWVAHAARLPLIGREIGGDSEAATAFVLRNGTGQELDVHVLKYDRCGYGIPVWKTDFIFPPDALAGRGTIAGTPVQCVSARMQMATHTGYVLQAKDFDDLRLLHERFGIAYLEEQTRQLPGSGT